ncbi:MAG TPA: cytochrome c [Polyangiaceae bacterium]|nr:cytochrome c [Polyangiaceae bacterium]
MGGKSPRLGFDALRFTLLGVLTLCSLAAQGCGGIAELGGTTGTGGAASGSTSGKAGAGVVANAGTAGSTLASGGSAMSTDADAGAANGPTNGSVARGAALYAAQSCNACHGVTAAGDQGPNITSSPSAGIGAWTYQQFHDALRLAKGKDGRALCLFMPPLMVSELSEQAIQDLYAFLKATPPIDTVNRGTYCGGSL